MARAARAGAAMKIAILPGDGIGPEIVAAGRARCCGALDLRFETEHAPVGGAAYEAHGHPLPEATLALAQAADAVLFGAVGDWKYDTLRARAAARAGDPRPAQGARPVRQLAPGDLLSGAHRRVDA